MMYATDKEKIKLEKLRWFLEVDDRFWKASDVGAGEVKSDETYGVMYNKQYYIMFDFTDMKEHPKWTKWTLYLLRKDLMEDFVWDFE